MEVSAEDSSVRYYEIRKLEGSFEKDEPPIEQRSNAEGRVGEEARCRRDATSSSASLESGKKVILLQQEPVRSRREAAPNRRVIELSDRDCKLNLRRQLETADAERASTSTSQSDENTEILRKLPPDTVVIKQDARSSKDDSDCKELTEANSSSGGSSSTSGRATAKVKRIPRAVRNKTRETAVNVRRNPMRISKKDIDKGFPRPRQRLLANGRREISSSYEPGRRTRVSSTMPYMNTRSVTRKMYTVGATYQAPTRRDETEWKEWPVHGMHERPVYHPQAGLAVEYLGRYFVSLDGLSYREIVDEPEIEVVAVDPRCDRRLTSPDSKPRSRARGKRAADDSYPPARSRSFQACVHGSFHCVLGYCSQVLTSSYRQAMGEGIAARAIVPRTSSSSEWTKGNAASCRGGTADSSTHLDTFAEESKLLEGYAVAMAQSAQNRNGSTSGRRAATSTVASASMTCTPQEASQPRSSTVELDGSKVVPHSGRLNLPTLRGFPNTSVVLLRSSNARVASGEARRAKESKVSLDPSKLEEVSASEDTLSSLYRKLMSPDEQAEATNRENSPAKSSSLYTLKRQSASAREALNPKRIVLENARVARVAKQLDANRNAGGDCAMRLPDGRASALTNPGKSRAWYTSETSEIARILSEYNRSTARKSAIQVYGSAAQGLKVNLAGTSVKSALARATMLWPKEATADENRNVGLDLSQGKWRRVPTPEKTGDAQIADGDRKVPGRPAGSSENCQLPSRERQIAASSAGALDYTREKQPAARRDLGKLREMSIDLKPSQDATSSEHPARDETQISRTEDTLQGLLENTAVLYCAANGVHQDDLSCYIDTLDAKQSIQWLESWDSTIV